MPLNPRQFRGCAARAAALLALAGSGGALAEDIDLFTGLQSNAGSRPNVLILLDNASAWNANVTFTCDVANVVRDNNLNTDIGAEQCAMYKAISGLISDPQMAGKINLGLMMFGRDTNVGGQFRFPPATPPTPPAAPVMRLMDSTGGQAFLDYIKSIDRQADNSNNSQVGGGMQEAWAFFAGKTGLSGTKYTSPISNPCQKNFVIYIANALNNGKPQDTGQNAYNALVAAGATSTQLTQIATPKGNKYLDNWGDEWARFMYGTDLNAANNPNGTASNRQNIVTYTIAVTDNSKNSKDYVDFATNMATNGGGGNYTVQMGDFKALADALKEIFNEMQAVNNVFASVSLPVSVNGQGSYLNQVYIGMFRPDGKAKPRWVGNLKQYKLGYDAKGNLVMLDAGPESTMDQTTNLSRPAINSAGTGFVSPNARSYWTFDAPRKFDSAGYSASNVDSWPSTGFWTNASPLLNGAKDSPDGEVVEKGGAAQMLRVQNLVDQSKRQLLTCASGACAKNTALAGFDTSNNWLKGTSGQSALGTTAADVANMVNWMRGQDVFASLTGSDPKKEAEPGPGGLVTVRGSVHGDVLHSRPVVVNYGAPYGIVVYYGANDGVFHAINGNQTSGITTSNGVVRPGGELWGFVPPEFYGKLGRLYKNDPEIQLTGSPTGLDSTGNPITAPRDYFFDGTTTVYQDMRNPSKPQVVIYLTARRGGRVIYALDVTDPTKPPVYLWSKSKADIAELGQTWSQPRVMQVHGYSSPLLIMGAGYDPANEDSDPASGTNVEGRGVIVFDALSGDVVWSRLADCGSLGATKCQTGPDRAIPSDVAVADRDGDGYVDKAYVGDVGGGVWRIDFSSAAGNAPANWSMYKLASLGGTGNAARKILYPPDVVSTGNYDAVLVGTGDREHPLFSYSTTPGTAQNVVNRFYMLKDTNLGKGMPTDWKPLTETALADTTATVYKDSALFSGFYITLLTGEKVVNAPLTVAGYTYFGTNTPSEVKAGACYPDLGIARGYAVSFLSGLGLNPNGNRYVTFDNGGLPPSPVFGMVSITQDNGSTRLVPVLIGGGKQDGPGGGDNTSSLGGQEVKPASVGKRKRTYWYTQADQK